MLHVTLDVHLGFLAAGRSGQGNKPEHTRADTFGKGFDGAALAGGIAAFKDDDDAESFVLDPGLEVAEFGLKFALLFHVFLAAQFFLAVGFGIFAHNVLSSDGSLRQRDCRCRLHLIRMVCDWAAAQLDLSPIRPLTWGPMRRPGLIWFVFLEEGSVSVAGGALLARNRLRKPGRC
jgi:hypothetical protein